MAFRLISEGSSFRYQNSSGHNLLVSTALLTGDWTFIAFTYDGTNSIGYMNAQYILKVSWRYD